MLQTFPQFDTGAKVVMALKKDADETDVKVKIFYTLHDYSDRCADCALTIPAYEAGMQVKLSVT